LWIAVLHASEIGILIAVDEFLHDDGGCNLGIVHVREEHFGAVAPVDEEWGQHLPLFTKEDGTAVVGGSYDLVVNLCVLAQPEMSV
jgi:hypothetical protein